jgi:hypothetical protein
MALHHLLMYGYDKLASIDSSTPLTSTSASYGLYLAVLSELPSRDHSEAWKTMTWNICQSVEYFLQGTTGCVGPLAIVTPLRGCKCCLESVPKDWSREISWITEFIERIQKKVDFPLDGLFGD